MKKVFLIGAIAFTLLTSVQLKPKRQFKQAYIPVDNPSDTLTLKINYWKAQNAEADMELAISFNEYKKTVE